MKRILWDIIYLASKEVCLCRKEHHWTLNLGKQGSLGQWPLENIYGITLAADFVGPGCFFVVRKPEVCRIISLAGFSSSVLVWIEHNWLCSSLKKTKWNKWIHIRTCVKRDLQGSMRFLFEISSWLHLSFSWFVPLLPPLCQAEKSGEINPTLPTESGCPRTALGFGGSPWSRNSWLVFSLSSGMVEDGTFVFARNWIRAPLQQAKISLRHRGALFQNWSIPGSHRQRFCVTFN